MQVHVRQAVQRGEYAPQSEQTQSLTTAKQSLGPADYLTLASTYQTLIITSIPIIKLSGKNQARRFISLIDALYEARCRIVCLAEAEPNLLFFPDATLDGEADHDVMMAEAVGYSRETYRPNVSSYDAPNMAEPSPAPHTSVALNTLSIFSGTSALDPLGSLSVLK